MRFMAKSFALIAMLLLGVAFPVAGDEIGDWSTTAASNNSSPPDGAPEGMAPSAVNDTMREGMAVIARWRDDTTGVTTTAGSSTAYTFSAAQTLVAYYDGLCLLIDVHVASGATPTLNVDSLGAKSLIWPDGSALGVGSLPSDAKALTCYDGTNFQVLTINAENITTTLTTQGDLLTRDASTVSRLAIGAADDILTTDGTDPAWDSLSDILDSIFGTTQNRVLNRGAAEWEAEPRGFLIGWAFDNTSAASSTASNIPTDGTIPQIGEGAEIFSRAFTANSGATLCIRATAQIEASSSAYTVLALYDGSADAIAASVMRQDNSAGENNMVLEHCLSGSGGSVTFSLRYGATAGTAYLNQSTGSTQLVGAVQYTTWVFNEYDT